jgi:hypothetical protein
VDCVSVWNVPWADAIMMPVTCQRGTQVPKWSVSTVSNGGRDDTHTLYEYGSMPRALAESERGAHLCGHRGASYAAEDGLTRCPGHRCAGCIAVAGRDWEYQYPGER